MARAEKFIKVGLGEALRRLLDLEIRMRHGVSTEHLTRERDLILTALNKVELNLGFDCDGDGLPESIALFKETSETSCCRLVDLPGTTPRAKTVERVLEPASRPASADTSRAPATPPRAPEAAPPPRPEGVAKPLASPSVLSNLFGGGKKK